MIINHNLGAMNSYRMLSANQDAQAKSTEKLSSGLRINKAGDDAAGLAISEKMRGQVRGLDQASRNAQDGISMLQTAEGSLQETHSILQRMRELAVQSSNDTNVAVDRGEIQKEMNQLTSEINRIGNTTEFNTQKLLKGDGRVAVTRTADFDAFQLSGGAARKTTEGKAQFTFSGGSTSGLAGGEKVVMNLAGEKLTISLEANDANKTDYQITDSSSTTARINLKQIMYSGQQLDLTDAMAKATQQMIDQNDKLKGQFFATASNGTVTIAAVKGGAYEGSGFKGLNVSGGSVFAFNSGTATIGIASSGQVSGTTTPAVQASGSFQLKTAASGLSGKGFTINGKQFEFYNAEVGSYKGSATGIAIQTTSTTSGTASGVAAAIAKQAKVDGVQLSASGAYVKIKAVEGGLAGNDISIQDGVKQENFKANFQVGANQGQTMVVDIKDMRAAALGLAGKAGAKAGDGSFTAANNVTDGTTDVESESALDVSTNATAAAAIKTINTAIEKVSAERSKIGAFTNRLEHTINNLATASENMTASESRVRDTDMAKVVMENSKNGILAQAAQAMLAQANQAPQQVLQLLR